MDKKTVQSGGITVMLLVVVAAIVLGFLMWTSTYNTLVTKEEGIKTSWGNVETLYQRRFDLIPNLVATVKGYATHEQQIWDEFAKARAAFAQASNIPAKVDAANQIEQVLSKIAFISEQYPELKANENFLQLQAALASTEDGIASARQDYNDQVRDYTAYKRQFLTAIIAGNGFKDYPYFKANPEASAVPTVNFGK